MPNQDPTMPNQDPSTAIINAKTGETLVPLAPLPPQLEESKALKIQSCFVGVAAEAQALVDMYPEFVNKEITEELVDLATEYKKRVAKTRSSITKIRKSEKEFYLRGGQFVDAIGKKLITPLEEIEGNLEPIINHFELLEAKRRAELRDKRWAELSQFTERYPERLDIMEEEDYQTLLAGAKVRHQEEIETRKLAEAKAKEEAEAFERLQEENNRLRREAEAARLEATRLEAERSYEASKAAAFDAAEAQRKSQERLAARLAVLPAQEATRVWIHSFEIPAAPVESPAVEVIKQKFDAFKIWALTQI